MLEHGTQHDPRSGPTHRKGNFLVALVGILSGLFMVGAAIGVFPIEQSGDAPLWLLGACGGIFIVAGIAALGIDIFPKRLRDFLGAIIMTGFLFIAGWIAFGPGEREFNGGIYSEAVGRTLFGISSIICAAIAVWAWKRVISGKE